MSDDEVLKHYNGEHRPCRYEDRDMQILNAHFEKLNEREKVKDEWMRDYVNKTMPIKSHYWILLGSLSILSSFAAIMQFIYRH